MSNCNPLPQEPDKVLTPVKQPPQPRSGRPRSTKVHRKIMKAARALAVKLDYGTISIQMVASNAQVAKTTIYRWWDSKAALMLEATYGPALKLPETGSLRGDLTDLLEQISSALLNEVGSHVTLGLWADLESSPPDSQARRLNAAHLQHEKAVLQEVLMQALKTGDLLEPQNPDLGLALLKGVPLQLRLALKVTDGELSNEVLADRILASLGGGH